MATLQQRQEKIQEKRKQTSFKDFIKEIASWCSLSLYRDDGIISRFPSSNRVRSVSRGEFEIIRDTLLDYGVDCKEDFLLQLNHLFRVIPLPVLFGSGHNENGDFADMGGHSKNVYLCFIYAHSENVFYTYNTKGSKNVYNSCCVRDESDVVYKSIGITKSYGVFYSKAIHDSSAMWFCVDCIGCNECMYCSGLINQSFCIYNKSYSRDEYLLKKRELLSKKEGFDTCHANLETIDIKVNCEDVGISNVVYNIKNGNNVIHSGGGTLKESFFDVVAGGATRDFYGVFQGVYFSEHVYCSAL